MHRIEDCLKCPLFQLYAEKWRKVYRVPIPVIDPVIARMAGFCPFHMLFSPVFWRNSVVIVSYRLLPLIPTLLERFGIKRVIVYLDEYLVQLNHRLKLKKINLLKLRKDILDLEVEIDGRKVKLRYVLERFNSIVDKIIETVYESYNKFAERLVEERNVRDEIDLYNAFEEFVARVVDSKVEISGEDRIFAKLSDIVSMLNAFASTYRLYSVRRFVRYIAYVYSSMFRSEFDGRKYRLVLLLSLL